MPDSLPVRSYVHCTHTPRRLRRHRWTNPSLNISESGRPESTMGIRAGSVIVSGRRRVTGRLHGTTKDSVLGSRRRGVLSGGGAVFAAGYCLAGLQPAIAASACYHCRQLCHGPDGTSSTLLMSGGVRPTPLANMAGIELDQFGATGFEPATSCSQSINLQPRKSMLCN